MLTGAAQNLGVHHIPDPAGHFVAHLRQFWIFEVLIEGMIESKAVRCCRQCTVAGGEQVPLGWYFVKTSQLFPFLRTKISM